MATGEDGVRRAAVGGGLGAVVGLLAGGIVGAVLGVVAAAAGLAGGWAALGYLLFGMLVGPPLAVVLGTWLALRGGSFPNVGATVALVAVVMAATVPVAFAQGWLLLPPAVGLVAAPVARLLALRLTGHRPPAE